MKKFGNALLCKAMLKAHHERLMVESGDIVRGLWAHDPDLPREDIIEFLQKTFCLDPLELGELQSVLVYVERGVFRFAGGFKEGYVGEARIAYTGSPILWRASPGKGLKFPYRGIVAKASVGWRAFTASKDLTPFEAEVLPVLEKTREALQSFEPIVRSWDARIRTDIDAIVRSF